MKSKPRHLGQILCVVVLSFLVFSVSAAAFFDSGAGASQPSGNTSYTVKGAYANDDTSYSSPGYIGLSTGINQLSVFSYSDAYTALNLINGKYVSSDIDYYNYPDYFTEPFPAIYSNTGSTAFWGSTQPVMVTAPINGVHDAGLLTFPSSFTGEITIQTVGVFDNSFNGDGFETYLFMTPPSGSNSSDVYVEYANFYFPQGDVLFPYSTTPYVVIQWDPALGGYFNTYIVENPNSNGTFSTSNIVKGGQTPFNSPASPSPGDYMLITTTYETNNSVYTNITDLNNSQVDYQNWLDLSDYGFPAPATNSEYRFGAGASGESNTGFGYIYIGVNSKAVASSSLPLLDIIIPAVIVVIVIAIAVPLVLRRGKTKQSPQVFEKVSQASNEERISQLREMRDEGLITQSDFEEQISILKKEEK